MSKKMAIVRLASDRIERMVDRHEAAAKCLAYFSWYSTRLKFFEIDSAPNETEQPLLERLP